MSVVKKFMLWMLVLCSWAVPAAALETNLMMHTDGEYLYIIKFVYDTDVYMTPATYPPGPPHYDAEITVTEVRSNAMVKVCQPWRGYYTARKCYEDAPEAVVRQALGRRWRRRMASVEPDPPLTPKVMKALGFVLVGQGKRKHWVRYDGDMVIEFYELPTAPQLVYEIRKIVETLVVRKHRTAIRQALNLDTP